MRGFFASKKFKIILSVWIALLLGFFVAAVSTNGSSPLSSVMSFIATPFEKAAVHITSAIEDFNLRFVSSQEYINEIGDLKKEIESLRSQLVDYEKSLHKLHAYEEFLDVKENNPDFTFIAAEIILRDSTDIYSTFTLNKGTDDGVEINCPVIYGENLVGIVKSVNADNCTVYTLFHPDISVSTYEIHTRENCYTNTQTDISLNGLIKLDGLAKNTPVVSGGVICTSGIGGIYPKDLIVGTVKEIYVNETQLAAYATVEPKADYSQLTDVFIITDFEGKTQTVNSDG